MEFDWGEEDDNKKSKKIVASKNMLNELTQKFSNVDYQITETDLIAIMPIMAMVYDRKSTLQAGDVYGKMLILTFEDNEDDMMNRILSLINTREEVIQMSGMNNYLLSFKGLMIDEVQRVIIRESQEIELTYTEFEILKLLAKHPGIVFSKEQIYDIVWKESYSGDYNIVMSHIRNIREKIEDNPSKPTYIQTVWGVGYRFNKNLSNFL